MTSKKLYPGKPAASPKSPVHATFDQGLPTEFVASVQGIWMEIVDAALKAAPSASAPCFRQINLKATEL